MSYKLRFVQTFKQEKAKEYLELEKLFAEFEQKYPEVPKGTRYLSCAGQGSFKYFNMGMRFLNFRGGT